MELEIRDLSNLVRRCDPGRYLTREEFEEVINRFAELEELERTDMSGHLGWLYMKVKANADHHDRSFTIPDRWALLYDDYKADLRIYSLSGLARIFAIAMRNFGLRRSFIQGPGSKSGYRK